VDDSGGVPSISVVVPVYNVEAYAAPAITLLEPCRVGRPEEPVEQPAVAELGPALR
jgi:hypothetical protein